jgi:hypothetical protein
MLLGAARQETPFCRIQWIGEGSSPPGVLRDRTRTATVTAGNCLCVSRCDLAPASISDVFSTPQACQRSRRLPRRFPTGIRVVLINSCATGCISPLYLRERCTSKTPASHRLQKRHGVQAARRIIHAQEWHTNFFQRSRSLPSCHCASSPGLQAFESVSKRLPEDAFRSRNGSTHQSHPPNRSLQELRFQPGS